MISVKDLCSAFRQPLAEHWGYIWGEAGDVWTDTGHYIVQG